VSFRYSICNEIYQGWDFAQACRSMRAIGYGGIEIAPFTLAEDPARIPAADRARYREIMQAEGIEFVGLHWLLAAPKGLHVTHPDGNIRKRSWEHVRALVDLCADLAGDRPDKGVMVFGSPQQRRTVDNVTPQQAKEWFIEGLAGVAPYAEERQVTILVEALPRNQCNVITTLAEAVEVVQRIQSPAVKTMFDVHNAVDEVEPHAVLVDRYFDLIRHIHVNEMDGRHPGTGDYNFVPLFEVLARRGFQGWISLEAFDFSPGAERIARESLEYLKRQAERVRL